MMEYFEALLLKSLAWKVELWDFLGKRVARFVTKREIIAKDIKWLVNKLAEHPLWREKIYHINTGPNCKEDGTIGVVTPSFSLQDIQKIASAKIKCGVSYIDS